MASLKVFISSTCYDLGAVRAELRSFITGLGHEPILSEFNDILFDPADHTHESCVKEVPNADIIILIIGSRFGGKIIPQALGSVDIDQLKEASRSTKLLDTPENLSVTQVEILKAIELDIPVFTFVDNRVLSDHLIYEKNKDKPFIGEMEFASIERKDTATFIFEFINFLRSRIKNNSLTGFSKISDIEDNLKKQWSGLLQRLIQTQRSTEHSKNISKMFLEGIEDIKSLIMTTISSEEGKEIGKGVLKFRKLIEFIQSFPNVSTERTLYLKISWEELLVKLGIEEFFSPDNRFNSSIIAIMSDQTITKCNLPGHHISMFQELWPDYILLNERVKEGMIEAIEESTPERLRPVTTRLNMTLVEYIEKREMDVIRQSEAVRNIRTGQKDLFNESIKIYNNNTNILDHDN